jgi:hypothetical protein
VITRKKVRRNTKGVFRMKNKFLIVGLISLMMVAGLALSCKKDEPCCTAADYEKWGDDLSKYPKCCQDAITKAFEFIDESTGDVISGKEADFDAALGCCLDAAKEAGW